METQQTPVAFSGSIPQYYDSFLGTMYFEPYALDLAKRINKISPKNLLELASGTGRLTKLLPGVTAKGASIIASDINPAMINFGQSKVQDDKIKWQVVDAVSLPFDDSTFDCVVVQFGVMFYSDRIKSFREAWRVLKPGGTFLFNCWDELKTNPLSFIADEALHQFFPVDTPAFFSIPYSYYDEKIIRSDLQQAGFENTTVEVVKLTSYSKTAADAAKGLIQGTPTVTAIEERDAKKLPLILAHIDNEIAKQFGKESLKVPLQARIVSAIKK